MRKLKLEELGRISVEDFRAQEKRPLVLVLDNIRSGLNVGSIFRTADAFAIEKIVLCGITAQPPHREILKSAIGATKSVKWSHFTSTQEAINDLRKAGYQIWGVEQTSESLPLQEASWQGERVALIFGNEVLGISEPVLPLLDSCLEVPQFGSKHSLNVGVCAGIVVWHLMAKLRE